jgi:rhamnogalacturonan acetylesterase
MPFYLLIYILLQAVISLFTTLGKTTVDSYFPFEHTHTNTAGAIKVASAFVSRLECPAAQSALGGFVNSAGEGLSASC